MDGGDVSREDRVRVRVSLAGDSDDWQESERFGGSRNPSAFSGVGVVDEEAAVCRWNRQGDSTLEVRGQRTVSQAMRRYNLTLTCVSKEHPSLLPLPTNISTRLSLGNFNFSHAPILRISLLERKARRRGNLLCGSPGRAADPPLGPPLSSARLAPRTHVCAKVRDFARSGASGGMDRFRAYGRSCAQP